MEQAGRLRREARAALEADDFERARALTARAEQLAAEVGAGVAGMERRQSDEVMLLVAAHHAAASSSTPRRSRQSSRLRRIAAALGAGLAMSLALAEC